MKKRFSEEQIVKMIQEHKQGKVFLKSAGSIVLQNKPFINGNKSTAT